MSTTLKSLSSENLKLVRPPFELPALLLGMLALFICVFVLIFFFPRQPDVQLVVNLPDKIALVMVATSAELFVCFCVTSAKRRTVLFFFF